jgi:hypothetical protein
MEGFVQKKLTCFLLRYRAVHKKGPPVRMDEWMERLSWRVISPAYASTLRQYPAALPSSQPASSTSSSGADFSYRPLDSGAHEIRLIHLLPRSSCSLETNDQSLWANLEHISLDSSPAYAALSYTWGDTESSESIMLDGKTLKIGKTLTQALMHLQHDDKTLVLWIDAVCINQADMLEKTEQVQQMGAIFERASLVLAWLGPAADESDLALKKLLKMARMAFLGANIDSNTSHVETRKRYQASLDALLSQVTVGEGAEVDLPMTPILHLFQRPWWQRVWVMQEVVMAKSVIFICGHDEIPSLFLNQAFMFLVQLSMHPARPTYVDANAVLRVKELDRRPMMMLNGSLGGVMYRNKPFIELLEGTGPLSATDPRDKIFALLGMACDRENLKLRADYSKPCEAVYSELAATLLKSGELGVLSWVQHPKTLRNLPTWVPDFSRGLIKGTSVAQAKIAPTLRRFAAGRGKLPDVCVIEEDGVPKTLKLAGILVGAISYVGRWALPETDTLQRASNWLAGFESFARARASAYVSAFDLKEAIWRTPIADQDYTASSDGLSSKSTETTYKAYRVVRGFDTVPVGVENPLEWRLRHGMSYIRMMEDNLRNKLAFVSSGRLVGFGTSLLQEGDLIVIFNGAEVPYILRQDLYGRYGLAGEAYVHGIMYGEFLETHQETVAFEMM